MSHKLNEEARMTLKELFRRGWTRCRIAKVLGVSEGAVRHHLKRQAEEARVGAPDLGENARPFFHS